MIIKTLIKKHGNESANDYINLPFIDTTNQRFFFKDSDFVGEGEEIIGVITNAVDLGDSFELTVTLKYELGVGYQGGIPFEVFAIKDKE